jgi:hypothetical protein
MPGFDRTGPMGAGPMTGGARGRCKPASTATIPAFAGGSRYGRGLAMRRGFMGGRGFGPGRGYGRGNRWYPIAQAPAFQADPSAEIDMLKAEAGYLKNSLDAVNARIDELENKTGAEA